MVKVSNQSWHSKKKLAKWFKKLAPEKRLEIANQIEMLRKGAKIVRIRDDI
ncbi:MAG: hypothetical protein QMD21_06895 [Candidatus Thermoplasmatota archaeon]|nr:hypothetical protein [Candidatus Thermoplasmatota archaeon]